MVRRKVEAGQFESEREVVEEALRQMDEREKLERLKAAIAVGDEQFERGEFTTWTPDSLAQLIREADEEDRQGLPIPNEVQPQT
jgi:antitoxin ParD1/3/4